MREGILVDRRPFMQNYFVIAGPPADPAGVRTAPSAAAALRRVVEAKAPFVSRGDDSGTHRREVALFREAGIDTDAEWEGFARTGAGMGLSLQVAGERRAYILSDLGTFRAFRERTGLAALSRPDPALLNVYSVLRPNPTSSDTTCTRSRWSTTRSDSSRGWCWSVLTSTRRTPIE